MADIDKESLEHLAELARIRLEPSEEDKLISDLRKILGHFEELRALDTTHAPAMSGGTTLRDVFREDASESPNPKQGPEGFPSSHKGFLKVPPVFE